MNDEKMFLNANDVSKYMSISVPMAYKIIRKLNNELEANGYITIAGKVNKRFFESKIYGDLNTNHGGAYACV